MRCIVTGASGFLGSWLVRQLLERGHSVIVLMRGVPQRRRVGDWLERVRIVKGSIESAEYLCERLADEPIDAFFHLAWSGVTAEYRDGTEQISMNVVGCLKMWELARDIGCKHWIGLGSQAEYGPTGKVLHEDLAASPATAYGVAKLACGLLTGKLSELAGIRHTWVRLLAVYGPGDDPKHLIPSVIQTLCAGRKPALTRGEQQWDYLYVEDAAKALSSIAEAGATGTLNLSAGKTVQIRRLVEMIRDFVDPHLPLGFGDIPYTADQLMHLEADIGRLHSATGWHPETPLQEGLRRTVECFKSENAENCRLTQEPSLDQDESCRTQAIQRESNPQLTTTRLGESHDAVC
jgi:UDP-glucose 4-epimerase